MGADADTRIAIHAYMTVWFVSAPLLLMQVTANGALRATGNTRTPALLMTLAAILNGIFDPLLIFGLGPFPELGIRGAAVAGLLAWTVSASVLVYRLGRDLHLEPLRELRLDALLQTWRAHLTISGPAAAANMLTPVATGIITAVLAGYGAATVAAYGVSIRIEALALIVILALSASLPPFISQNFGAGRLDRVRDALRGTVIFTMLWQALVYLAMLPFVAEIAVIFTDDTGVAEVLTTILYVLPLSYGFQGVVVLCNSSLNALHEPQRALALSVLRWGAFYVPGALIGVAVAGVPGLIAGAALGNVAGAVLAVHWAWRRAADDRAVLAPG